MRPGASRNQRAKGFRVKQVLQLCLLAVVCIWLLYQLKHSYEKKRALEESNPQIFDRVAESQTDLFKLGRKELPHNEETSTTKEAHNNEEDKEEAEEEEEQETKQEIENEEGRGAGDDEIDETDDRDQERVDEEAEHGEESADEAEKDVQVEGIDLLDDEEHEGGSQEAREEHYKRDDASNAVGHDTQTTESEFGNGDAGISDEEQMENMEKKDVERGNMANETVDAHGSNGNVSSIVLGENGTMSNVNLSMNGASDEKREAEVRVSELEVQSISNSTPPIELQTNSTSSAESSNQMQLQSNSTAIISNNKMETRNNSTEVDAITNGVPPQNETVQLDSVQEGNATLDTGNTGENKPDMADAGIEQTEKSNTSKNGGAAQGESDDPSQTEKSNTDEKGDAAQGESDDSLHMTLTAEEREARTDLSTLPDIKSEAKNDDDDQAAE